MKKGKLTLYYGPMYSGKSALLIKDILSNIDKSKLVFKPKDDVRSNKVYTREGLEFRATEIENASEISNYVKDWVETVYIDEYHFFDKELLNQIDVLLENGIDVVISGLDTDFRSEKFDIFNALLTKASKTINVKATCHLCGELAPYSSRYINGTPATKESETIISDKANNKIEYFAVCKKHHPFLIGRRKSLSYE